MEIEVNGRKVFVDYGIWRSWTGRRWFAGHEVHGPVFLLGTDELAGSEQARQCPCCDRRSR
jgi:hypothetical protein